MHDGTKRQHFTDDGHVSEQSRATLDTTTQQTQPVQRCLQRQQLAANSIPVLHHKQKPAGLSIWLIT
jgi:hypothetical protein